MIGFVSTALYDWDMNKVLNFAINTGFDAIVLNAHRQSPWDVTKLDLSKLKDDLQTHSLGLTSIADMSLNLLQANTNARSEEITYMYKLIDASVELGVNLVTMFAGRDPEKSVQDNIPIFKEVFTPLANYAGECGVRLAFENCPLFEDFPYRGRNIAYAPAVWDMMFEAVPAKNIGIELDTAHAVWLQQDLTRMVKDYASRIFHIHLKDCHVDSDRLHHESIYGHGWWSYETPGDGDIDWQRFFESLRQIKYQGDWTFDLKGGTRLTELPRGLAFVQPLLKRIFEPA